MPLRFSIARASVTRAVKLALLSGATVASACSESPTASAKRPMVARIVFFAPGGVGERMAVHFTIPRNGTRLTIQRDTFDVQAGPNRLQPLVDITDCVDATKRCTLYASLMLLSSTNVVLDSSEVGPFVVTAGGSTQAPSVTLVAPGSIRLSRSALSMLISDSAALAALVIGRNGDTLRTRSVAWESRNPTVATVSTGGVVRAITAGTTTVLARSGDAVDSARVTVSLVPVARVSVRVPNTELTVGLPVQATAAAVDSVGNALTGRVVAWSSLNASVASVSGSGLVTPVAPGTATIRATVEGRIGDTTVTVFPAVAVSVAPATATVVVGRTTALSASVTGGAPSLPRTVTWTSRSPTVATVSASGVVSAVAAGTARIIVASVADSTRRDSATVTVLATSPVAVVSVRLTNPALVIGGTTQAIATALDALGDTLTGRPVTWSSSASTVASVSASGVVSALSAGTAVISAVVEGIAASATVTVYPAVSVSISPRSVSLTAGGTAPLTATIGGGVPSGSTAVTWATTAAAVATVNSTGVVTAVSAGNAYIVATSVQDVTRRDSIVVAVSSLACGGQAPALVRGGTISTNERWTIAQSPVLLQTSVTVNNGAKLQVDAGVVVCGAPFTSLFAQSDATVEALGTRAQPIIFQSADTTQGWLGLRLLAGGTGSPVSRLVHVRLSGGPRGFTGPVCNASGPLQAVPGHAIVLDTVLIHNTTATNAASIQSNGSILRSVTVDSVRRIGACQTLAARGLVLSDGVIADGLIVRNAEAAGIQLQGVTGLPNAPVVLGNVRLEQNGAGLFCASHEAIKSGPIVITGNRGMPFECSAQTLANLAPDSLSFVNWLGNQRDTVVIIGNDLLKRDTLHHFAVMPWRIASGMQVDTGFVLDLRPGAKLFMDPIVGITVNRGGRIVSRGTHARPVLLSATDSVRGWDILFLEGVASDSSYIVNTIIEHGSANNPWALWVHSGSHLVAIDSSWVRKSKKGGVLLQFANSRLSRTLIDSSGSWGLAFTGAGARGEDIVIRGSGNYGLHVDRGSINGLEVTGSAAEGMQNRSGATQTTFQRINLFGNAGAGATNTVPFAFSVLNAWWGDPAGPNGPQGDGVGASVGWSPPSATKFTVIAAPPIHP